MLRRRAACLVLVSLALPALASAEGDAKAEPARGELATVAVPGDRSVYVVHGAPGDRRVLLYLHGRCGDPHAGIRAFAREVLAGFHEQRGESEEAVLRLQEDLRQYGGKGGPLRDAMNRMALAGELLELGRAQETMEALGALGDGPETRAFEWERRWLAARALHRLNQPLQAVSEARAAVAAAAISSPPEGRSALHGRAYLELARALAGQGRADEARAAAERALAELDDSLGPEHSATRAARQLARR